MRKIFGALALAGGICTSAIAQADLTYAVASLEGYSRTEVVQLLLTAQYDGNLLLLSDDASLANYNKNKKPTTNKEPVKVGDKPFYPDLDKNKAPEREYAEIEVVNLNGMYLSDIVIGAVTNTLDKEKRYIEIKSEDLSNPLVINILPAIELSMLDSKNTYTYKTAKNYTIGTSKGKYFIITEDNTYRYYDSSRLGGSAKLVEELKNGKPITAQTFFYEAQESGLIDDEMTLKEFLNMSIEQHRNLLVIGE